MSEREAITEKANRKKELREAYRRMAERDKEINKEWKTASREANRWTSH